ncbi:MAG: DUF6807 domain-containing protein [Planctomycetota bacterium]|jgi:hypothetical protein
MTTKQWIFLWLLFSFACSCSSAEQHHYQFALKAGGSQVLTTPLSLDIEGINYHGDSQKIVLYRLNKDEKIPLLCQFEDGHTSILWFIPDRIIKPNETVIFEIAFEDTKKQEVLTTSSTDAEAITLSHRGKNILRYYHALHEVPKDVDPLFRRSGFIHPLWSPAGKVLTQIQPPDHYHHYGIWNPWTKTRVEGQGIDFWNLGEGQGTVRFAGVLSTISGPVYGGFKVKQEHVVFKAKGKDKIAINEVWDVRAFVSQIENRPVWVIDFTTILHNALDSPIELLNYRYGGGIGFRATENWTRNNCSVLTSEGKTRKEADGTRARWCDVNGATGSDQRSGIIFLSHIANREHPEPMRVWPLDAAEGKGYMFFEFCPIRFKSWNLEPETENVLRYRMIVYDGKISPETADVLWKNYTQPPVITLKR